MVTPLTVSLLAPTASIGWACSSADYNSKNLYIRNLTNNVLAEPKIIHLIPCKIAGQNAQPMLVICACMRKLVHICFGVVKHQKPFQS